MVAVEQNGFQFGQQVSQFSFEGAVEESVQFGGGRKASNSAAVSTCSWRNSECSAAPYVLPTLIWRNIPLPL